MSEQIPKSTLFKSTIFLTWNGSKLIVSGHLQRGRVVLVTVAMVRAGEGRAQTSAVNKRTLAAGRLQAF